METILDKIIENKKIELRKFKLGMSIDDILPNLPATESTFSNIVKQSAEMGIIAEIKMKSPSGGDMTAITSNKLEITRRLVREYVDAGVDAISIVTDEKYFGGDVLMIEEAHMSNEASTYMHVPIFQKDFIIDPIQIYFSKLVGASALLLIARVLDKKTLNEFVNLCYSIKLEPVVEVYDKSDLEKTLTTKAKFIGVNARNLSDFSLDIKAACKLGKLIPKDKIFIGFSGIKGPREIKQYKSAGAKAVLIGTNLMKADNIGEFILSLRGRTTT